MNNLERKQLVVDGQLISYLVGGEEHADKRVLVFLHGWRSEASVWNPVLERLTDESKVVAFDLPGFGKSENPHHDFEPKDYAEILLKACEKLGISECIVVGHSYGGGVASLMSTLGGSIQKLVLVGSAGVRTGGIL